MDELFVPMLYTSLTSAAGFASLMLASVPPVQVFGVFVAFGIMLAWLFTITLVPAYVMRIKPSTLEHFGAVQSRDAATAAPNALSRFLHGLGRFTYRHGGIVLTATGLMVIVASYGMSLIEINDNPTKWFAPSHPIREADRVLNEHFGGTYEAYLALEPADALDTSHDDTEHQAEIFKQPAVLRYMADLQQAALTTQIVGKSNSVADIVKTIHRELFLGEADKFRIPDTANTVAQCLITFESGHRPNDL
jgi:predicted RND superfamily exporter protein